MFFTQKQILELINGSGNSDNFQLGGGDGIFPDNNTKKIAEIDVREALTKIVSSNFAQDWQANTYYLQGEWVTFDNKIYRALDNIPEASTFDDTLYELFYDNTNLVSTNDEQYRYGYFKVSGDNYDITQPKPIGTTDGLYIVGATGTPDPEYKLTTDPVFQGSILIIVGCHYGIIIPQQGDLAYNLDNDDVLKYTSASIWESLLGGAGSSGVIGPAEDGDYTDGVFTDFTPTTPIGTAVDRFNELFNALLPNSAPALTDFALTGDFSSGKLSFDTINTVSGTYEPVPGSSINDLYSISGNVLGITKNGTLTGALNDQVNDGDPSGIPYENGAFTPARDNILRLVINGTQAEQVDLATQFLTTDKTTGLLRVSRIKLQKSESGSDLQGLEYRTGSLSIDLTSPFIRRGYNTVELEFEDINGTVTSIITKEFIVDRDSQTIVQINPPNIGYTPISSIYLSGIQYPSSGGVDISVTTANVYQTTFADGTAIRTVSSRLDDNLANIIATATSGGTTSNGTLPNLTASSTAYASNLTINASIPFSSQSVFNATVTSQIEVDDTISTDNGSSSVATLNEVFYFNINQASDTLLERRENFTGELRRMTSNFDFATATYLDYDADTWDSTENFNLPAASEANGLQVLPVDDSTNGHLVYPELDFSSFSNIFYTNPNYSGFTSGLRTYVRKFKVNQSDEPDFTVEFVHSGDQNTFLRTPDDTGTPTGTQLKVNVYVKKVNGDFYGPFNPFLSLGDGFGPNTITTIERTSLTHSGNTTTLSTTFGSAFTISVDDFLVFEIVASEGWKGEYIEEINVLTI